jgi:hypothetical protein
MMMSNTPAIAWHWVARSELLPKPATIIFNLLNGSLFLGLGV